MPGLEEAIRQAAQAYRNGDIPARTPCGQWSPCVHAGEPYQTTEGGRRLRLRYCQRDLEPKPICECGKCGGVRASDRYRQGEYKVFVLHWGKKQMPLYLAATLQRMGWHVLPGIEGTGRALSIPRGAVKRGESNWKDESIRLIKAEKPDLFLTVQRLYDGQWAGDVGKVLRDNNVATLIMDFGVGAGQQHYDVSIFDPEGENATSELAGYFDALAAMPEEREAIEANLVGVDGLRAELLSRAEACTPQILKRHGLDKIPAEFALAILQKTGDAVLRFDSTKRSNPEVLAEEIIHRCHGLGVFCVAKPHPFEPKPPRPGERLGGLVLGKIRGDVGAHSENHLISAWLLAHCSHIVTVNSTMLYQAMALDKPITMLGRGWATGNGLVHEQHDVRTGKFSLPTEPTDRERRRRFLALMLSRQLNHAQCQRPEAVGPFLRRWERHRGLAATVITTVYAPDARRDAMAKASLEATRAACEWPVIAATDAGQPGFRKWCAERRIDYLALPGKRGERARMNKLLEAGLAKARGNYVWTIESDCFVSAEIMREAERIMRDMPPHVASLSLTSVDEAGRLTFPASKDIRKYGEAWGGDERIVRMRSHNCFGACLWRWHPLARVDWAKTPPLFKCDIQACAQIRQAGFVHLCATHLPYLHYPHASYRDRGFTPDPTKIPRVPLDGLLAIIAADEAAAPNQTKQPGESLEAGTTRQEQGPAMRGRPSRGAAVISLDDLRSKLQRLGTNGYFPGNSAKPGHTYHRLPLEGFADVPAHRDTSARHAAISRYEGTWEHKAVLDVGANVGGDSIPIASAGGLVDAVEPHALSAEVLEDVAGLADVPVTVHAEPLTLEFVEAHGPWDAVLLLSSLQWVWKAHGADYCRRLLAALYQKANRLYLEAPQARDGRAGIPEAKDRLWLGRLLKECGWDVDMLGVYPFGRHRRVLWAGTARRRLPACQVGECRLASATELEQLPIEGRNGTKFYRVGDWFVKLRPYSDDHRIRRNLQPENEWYWTPAGEHFNPPIGWGRLHDGTPYVAYPWLAVVPDTFGPLAKPEPLRAILDALKARQCLHRDIRPGNLLVTTHGRLILHDFEWATHISDTRLDSPTVPSSGLGEGFRAKGRFDDAESVRRILEGQK